MSNIVVRFITGAFSPLISLSEKVQKYQQKRKTRDQLADALETEIKDYMKIVENMKDLAVDKFLPTIQAIQGQPTPPQIFKVVDCLSQTPRICGDLIRSFIGLSRACWEISSDSQFMDSLRDTSGLLYAFVERMRDAYVEKDTVKIDGRFFRFFSLHKKEILKGIKIGKVNKGEFELVEKRMKSVIRCLNEDFLKRYARKSIFRRWHHGLIQLGKISQSIVLEQPSRINIDAFIPPELQSLTTFLDEFS